MNIVERCPTGIKGFDEICEGGFVRNSSNIIIGGPGSGKTTFLLEFLWNGATKFNENGLYCSFEPDIVETLKDGLVYGWDFAKLNEQDKIKFMKFSPSTSIGDLKSELTKLIAKYNIKRICFDPISVVALNLNDEGKIREAIFDLCLLMKRLKVTSLFSDESIETNKLVEEKELGKTDIMKFLTDSVIILYDYPSAFSIDRALRIIKMRRTDHERMPVGMKISKKGIEIFRLTDENSE